MAGSTIVVKGNAFQTEREGALRVPVTDVEKMKEKILGIKKKPKTDPANIMSDLFRNFLPNGGAR